MIKISHLLSVNLNMLHQKVHGVYNPTPKKKIININYK